MNSEEYIDKRLVDQINWYDKKSIKNQKTFRLLRIIEIIAAALIPFISGITINNINSGEFIIYFTSFLGVLITIIASYIALGNHQEKWIEYRTTCESLKKELFLFETKVMPYDTDISFPLLVKRVETIISKENTNWSIYSLNDNSKKET
ncbi:DUF4231 domain-containing protein [Marinifilum sp.]|uniref:DUF4231 domain-containing protein n=1 Tax=Marinifilum sp. TaxID=2033137 RepID=UPI003BAC515D